jgi:hypothetical protein
MPLANCPNSTINRLFSKQNILITDYGQEEVLGKLLAAPQQRAYSFQNYFEGFFQDQHRMHL